MLPNRRTSLSPSLPLLARAHAMAGAATPDSRRSSETLSTQFSGAELDAYRQLFNGCRAGDQKTVTALLAKGMRVNCVGPRGATPLHIAARFGQLEMVRLLLSHGADPLARDARGQTPANKAQAVGEQAIVQQLAKAQVQAQVDAGESRVIRERNGVDPAPADAKPKRSIDPRCRKFFEACHDGNVESIRGFISATPDVVHVVGPRGATALHIAARYGHPDAIMALLAAGADACIRDSNNNTPGEKARQFKHERALALLTAAEKGEPLPTGQSGDVGLGATVEIRPDPPAAEVLINPAASPAKTDMPSDYPEYPVPTAPPPEPTEAELAKMVVVWHRGMSESELELADVDRPWAASDAYWLCGTAGAAIGHWARIVRGTHSRETPLTIGRHQSCSLQLSDAEVSSQHATLWWDDGAVRVRDDPGSFNGTFVRLSAEKERSFAYPIESGDVFYVGEHTLTLEAPGADGEKCALLVRKLPTDEEPEPQATRYPLSRLGRTTIGRARNNDISLADQKISASHAEVRWVGNATDAALYGSTSGWVASDLGSSNGTSIRLSPERVASRPFKMTTGHALAIGNGPRSPEMLLARCICVCAARKGRRPTMEDAHVICHRLLPPHPSPPPPQWPSISVFAVYDGHGGGEASEFCKQKLHSCIAAKLAALLTGESTSSNGVRENTLNTATDVGMTLQRKDFASLLAQMAAGGREGAQDVNTAVGAAMGGGLAGAKLVTPSYDGGDDAFPFGLGDLSEVVHDAFVATDEAFLKQTSHTAGSTAVVAMLANGHLIVGNAGDSRAYLWRDGKAIQLTIDHKPDRPDETARINQAGGWVAGGRVMRALAVSRAIGDRDFKRCELTKDAGLPFTDSLVVPNPEVRVVRVQEGDELLLACDGLWDVMSPEDAFRQLEKNEASTSPQRAIDQLARMAEVELSSGDNITAVYVRL